MSGEKLYKTLKNQIKDRRGDLSSGDRWNRHKEIGEHSKKLLQEESEGIKKYYNSKEYKNWNAKVDKLNKSFENDYNSGKYKQKWQELIKQRPPETYKNYSSGAYYINLQKYYVKGYLSGAGKDMTIAKLKDLGYNEKVAKEFTERLIKSKYSLGDI